MPFKKGNNANPAGRPKGSGCATKSFKDALSVALQRTEGDKVMLALIAEKLVEKAAAGDIQAINAVADRTDGKPVQTLAGDPENPLTVLHEAGRSLDAKLDRLIGRGTAKAKS